MLTTLAKTLLSWKHCHLKQIIIPPIILWLKLGDKTNTVTNFKNDDLLFIEGFCTNIQPKDRKVVGCFAVWKVKKLFCTDFSWNQFLAILWANINSYHTSTLVSKWSFLKFLTTLISRKIKGMENYLISTLYALLQAWHGILYHFISSHWNCYLRFLALTYIWTFYVLTRIHCSYPNTDIMRQRSSQLLLFSNSFIVTNVPTNCALNPGCQVNSCNFVTKYIWIFYSLEMLSLFENSMGFQLQLFRFGALYFMCIVCIWVRYYELDSLHSY